MGTGCVACCRRREVCARTFSGNKTAHPPAPSPQSVCARLLYLSDRFTVAHFRTPAQTMRAATLTFTNTQAPNSHKLVMRTRRFPSVLIDTPTRRELVSFCPLAIRQLRRLAHLIVAPINCRKARAACRRLYRRRRRVRCVCVAMARRLRRRGYR